MANYEQVKQELEALKSKFMLLNTDEERKAFRSEMEAFATSKSDEEKQLASDAFIEGAKEACMRADKLIDDVLRNKLDGIYESISWSYIARTYFNKSRACFFNFLALASTSTKYFPIYWLRRRCG